MKVLAVVRKDNKNTKVNLYEGQRVDIPFEVIMRNNIVDWAPEFHENIPEIHTIMLKKENREISGVVVYNNLIKLADFIVDEYQPNDQLPIDYFLKEIQHLGKNQKKKCLLDILVKQKMNCFDNYHINMGSNRICGPGRNNFEFAMNENDLLRSRLVVTLELPGKKTFFRSADCGRSLVYADKPYEIKGKIINQNIFLFIVRRAIFYWDGTSMHSRFKGYGPLNIKDFAGEKTYEELEKNGNSALIKSRREIFAPSNFKPYFLLRVPAAKEYREDMLKKDNLPNKLKKSYYLFDVRGSVKLNSSLEIIDDPALAVGILARSPKGIFLPDDFAVSETARKYLEEKEYYIACGGF